MQHQQNLSPPSPQSDKQQTPAATPTSVHSVATPPTVVRRVGNSSFYSPLISVTRRISFTSGQITPKARSGDEDAEDAELEASRSRLFEQLDSMKLDDGEAEAEEDSPPRPAIRRRRRLMRKPMPEPEAASASEEEEVVIAPPPPPPYNNETVYLGEAPPPYNNETVTFGATEQDESLQQQPSP